MPVSIRRAGPSDAPVITEFNRLLAEESEGKTLDVAILSRGVAAALADARKVLYFVAEDASATLPRIVGQISVTFEWSDWRNGWMWWFQSVYVRPEARRQGVFRAMYDHVYQAARNDPEVIGLRLYVEEHNHAAQETYRSMGMERTGYFVLEKHPL